MGYCPVCVTSYNLSSNTVRFRNYIHKIPPVNEFRRQIHKRLRRERRNAKRLRRRKAKSQREAKEITEEVSLKDGEQITNRKSNLFVPIYCCR